MFTRLTFLLLVGSVAFVLPLFAEATTSNSILPTSKESIFDQLHREGVLELTIETDLANLIDNRKSDEYQPAVIKYEDRSGMPQTWMVDIKARGRFRRRICDFPPLKINFSKEQLSEKGLAKFDKLKLVTHCMEDKGPGNENVLKEYLAYRIYNELTDYSFRVQLVAITYIDLKGQLSRIKRYGFLIEDDQELADRIGGEVCECLNPDASQMDERTERIHAVFEYLIGNEDWSIPMGRNLKMVRRESDGKLTPVPYDFDFAGMINASYAIPNSDHGLTSIRDRIYLGFPSADTDLWYTIQYFRQKREDIKKITSGFKILSRTGRDDVLQYFDSFYALVDELESKAAQNLFGILSRTSTSSSLAPVMPETSGFRGE